MKGPWRFEHTVLNLTVYQSFVPFSEVFWISVPSARCCIPIVSCLFLMLPCTSPWMIVFGSSDDIWNVFPQICICLLKSIGFRRFHSFPLPISSCIMVFVEGMLFPHWWCKNDPPGVFQLNGLYTFFCKSAMLGSTFDEHIARWRWPAYCCSVFLLLNLPLFSTVFSCLWLIQYPLTVSNAMSRPSWCHSFCFVICWINPLR